MEELEIDWQAKSWPMVNIPSTCDWGVVPAYQGGIPFWFWWKMWFIWVVRGQFLVESLLLCQLWKVKNTRVIIIILYDSMMRGPQVPSPRKTRRLRTKNSPTKVLGHILLTRERWSAHRWGMGLMPMSKMVDVDSIENIWWLRSLEASKPLDSSYAMLTFWQLSTSSSG